MTDSPEVQSLELGRFGSILRHHWRLASAIFALFVGAAVAYLVVTPKTYEATAVVQLNVISENPFGGDRPASALVDASTEQQVGRSSQVLTAAAQAMGESAPAVDKMRNRTTISPVPSSAVVRVSFTAGTPKVAAAGANAIADAYLAERGAAADRRVQEMVEQLEARRTDVRASLLSAQQTAESSAPGSRARSRAESDIAELRLQLNDLVARINALESIGTAGGSVITPAREESVLVAPSRVLVIGAGVGMGAVMALIAVGLRHAMKRRVFDEASLARLGGGRVLGQLRGRKGGYPLSGSDGDQLRGVRERLLSNEKLPEVLSVVDLGHRDRISDAPLNLAQALAESRATVAFVLSHRNSQFYALLQGDFQSVPESRVEDWDKFVSISTPSLSVWIPTEEAQRDSARLLRDDLPAIRGEGTAVVAVPAGAPVSVRLAAATMCEVGILVAGVDSTRLSDVEDVIEEFDASGRRVLGSILVPRNRHLIAAKRPDAHEGA